MSSDTIVTLDGFEFRDFEVPERIPFGISHTLAKHKLIGGVKQVDSMGAFDEPLEWSGQFRGPEAMSRARELRTRCKAGKALKLTWGELAFTVKVEKFFPVFEKAYEVPYSITCEVISDDADPAGPASQTDVDEMVAADGDQINALGAKIGDAGLSGTISTLNGVLSQVKTFANASVATINTILQPLSGVEAAASGLFNSAQAVLGEVTSLGGVAEGMTSATIVSNLLRQGQAMAQSADLFDVQSYAGRMTQNLISVGSSGAQIVAAGGDLFDLASRAYGDATEWSTIARANGLSDPTIVGLEGLLIPPSPSGSGGVLAI